MKLRVLVPLLLAVAAAVGLVVGGLLPSGGNGASPTASSSATATASATGSPSQSASPSPSGSTTTSSQSNFKITKLAPGEKPPQFVVVSFDGA
ncbi:MAG: hypothetical protein WCJ42_05420, partial [Actinomycetes bacterium]